MYDPFDDEYTEHDEDDDLYRSPHEQDERGDRPSTPERPEPGDLPGMTMGGMPIPLLIDLFNGDWPE